jgi:hypothetical protein
VQRGGFKGVCMANLPCQVFQFMRYKQHHRSQHCARRVSIQPLCFALFLEGFSSESTSAMLEEAGRGESAKRD